MNARGSMLLLLPHGLIVLEPLINHRQDTLDFIRVRSIPVRFLPRQRRWRLLLSKILTYSITRNTQLKRYLTLRQPFSFVEPFDTMKLSHADHPFLSCLCYRFVISSMRPG